MKRKFIIILMLLFATLGFSKADSIQISPLIRLDTRYCLPENKIRGAVELSDGKIGLVTAGYVSVFNGNNFKSYHTSTFPFMRLDDYNSYRHVFRDNKDRIWIKHEHELMAFDPILRKGVNIDSLFSSIGVQRKITNLFANALGNYYFVNDRHDIYLWNEDSGLKFLDNISDVPYRNLERIEQTDGNIYLCFNSGLLVGIDIVSGKRIYKGEIPIDFSQCKLKKGIVTLFTGDKLIISFNCNNTEGAIVAAFLLSEKRWLSPIYLKYPVTSLCLLNNNDILVGGKVLTQVSSDFSFSDLPVIENIINSTLNSEVSCLVNDSFGNLWVGTLDDGLLYYNVERGKNISVNNEKFVSKSLKRYSSERAKTVAQKIATRITNATFEDSRENLYIATVSGLIILDKNNRQILKLDNSKGIDPDNIQSVVEDRNGDIWFATPISICRLKFLKSDSVSIASFNVLDGVELNGAEFRNCELKLDSLGFIHAGYTGGTYIFNPVTLNNNRLESYFELRKADVDKQTATSLSLIWIVIIGGLTALIGLIFWWKHRNRNKIYQFGGVDKNDLSLRINENKDLLMQVDSHVVENLKEKTSHDADMAFLEKLHSVVENHVSDPELSVQSLSEMMAMERSVLYRKMQALTGISPSEYIRDIRLKIATQLLKSDIEMSISDVSERVGFRNPKYFAKVFKSHYGFSPKDYISNH